MIEKVLAVLGISFLVYFNLALYNFTEPLYYLVLFCSLVGSYSIIKGIETNPR